MKKKILSFIMLFAVTLCFAGGCKNDNEDQGVLVKDGKEVVARINDEYYTADQLYEDMIDASTNAEYLYQELEDLLIKTVVPITDSMKNRINNEIEKWKKDIKENAIVNGTSYKDELKNALAEEGVTSEEELYDKKAFALQEEIITNQYWKNAESDYYTSYFSNNYVYHVSQILVSVSTYGNKDYFASEVTDSTAKKLYTVVNQLISGVPFYQIAEVYSDDTSTKANGGDLGLITLNDTSIPDEVKYALASYSIKYENAKLDQPEYMSDFYDSGIEAIAEKYINVLGEKYEDVTTHITATDSALSGSIRMRAKNILFNNLFNSRTFRFLQADQVSGNTEKMENIKLSVDESAIYELAAEDQNIVVNDFGTPIIVVRSDKGIHFLSITKSAFADKEDLMKYYSKEINDDDEVLTYLEKGVTAEERNTRLETLNSFAKDQSVRKISGNSSFSGNEDFIKYDMFIYYLSGKHNGIKFEIVNEKIKNIVLNYIEAQKEYMETKISNVFNLGYEKLSDAEENFGNTINVTKEIPLLKCLVDKGCTYTYAEGFKLTGGDN